MKLPASTPHTISNRKASLDASDKGSLFIVRPDENRVIVTVRSPNDTAEHSIIIPYADWLKLRNV